MKSFLSEVSRMRGLDVSRPLDCHHRLAVELEQLVEPAADRHLEDLDSMDRVGEEKRRREFVPQRGPGLSRGWDHLGHLLFRMDQ